MWRQRSSSQLLGASGQSGGLQVTLELPDRASVQRAKVEVKSSVRDVKVSRLLDQVHNLEDTGGGTVGEHRMESFLFSSVESGVVGFF